VLLLRKAKVKSVYQWSGCESKPSPEDKKWAEAAPTRIGRLKQPDITKPDIKGTEYLKKQLGVPIINKEKAARFLKKFNVLSNEQAEVLLSVGKDTVFKVGKEKIIIRPSRFWEIDKKKKFIGFAFNYYGDFWAFNARKQNCPVLFYDHETMLYEEQFASITDFIKTLNKSIP
jgi:hypothetical protein